MILPGYGTLLRHTKSAQFVKEHTQQELRVLCDSGLPIPLTTSAAACASQLIWVGTQTRSALRQCTGHVPHCHNLLSVKERAAELLVTLHILQGSGLVSSGFSTEFHLNLVPSCKLHRTLYRVLGWCQVVFQWFFTGFCASAHRIQPQQSSVVSDFELTC